MNVVNENEITEIEFVNRPLTSKEKKLFSEFLKLRKKRKTKKKRFGKESTTT